MATGAGATVRETTPATAPLVAEFEHVAAVLRTRNVIGIATLLWSAAVFGDLSVAPIVEPSVLRSLFAMRVAGAVVFASMWLRLRTNPRVISSAERRGHVILAFTLASALLSDMGILASGIASPYFGGVMMVSVFYGVAVAEPWRRALLGAAGAFLAYPVSMLVAASASPAIAAELRDPALRVLFWGNVANLAGAYAGVIFAGHIAWSLRRQVFETRSLGRYTLKRRIGSGGMGEVWLARDATLKRDVAVKILSGDLTLRTPNAVERFEREARATSELAHPNTVRVFDYGATEDGVWYYAMELLEGESFASLVAHEGAQPPARAIHLVSQAARALAEAHEKGIVHRDVKPENLFVARVAGEHDFVKVLDFGIAQIASTPRDAKLTVTGSLVGTPAWLAPEAIRGVSIDARADVYALGAVLYFLLAGRPPFEGTSAAIVASAHLHEQPAPPSAKRGEPLPRDLEDVVMRCLVKDPVARYPSARSLADALAACADAGAWTADLAAVMRRRAEARAIATDTTLDAPRGIDAGPKRL